MKHKKRNIDNCSLFFGVKSFYSHASVNQRAGFDGITCGCFMLRVKGLRSFNTSCLFFLWSLIRCSSLKVHSLLTMETTIAWYPPSPSRKPPQPFLHVSLNTYKTTILYILINLEYKTFKSYFPCLFTCSKTMQKLTKV
jgi:hypothetical protein